MSYKRNFVTIICFFLVSLIFVPLSVFANVPDQSHSSLSVNSSVPADGKTTAIITVTLHDSSDNPVIGHSVNVEDSSNSGAIIETIKDVTDENGHALYSIRSTKIQTDNLDVTDTTSNTKFYNLGKITFTTSGCFDSPPGSTPHLISAIPDNSSQITLTWTAAANPVTRYLVSYGLTSGQYIYGNPNVGGQGVTSYTVGSLTPGKKYYFIVQPINGCTPGNFSNEISAIADEDIVNTSTPALTPINTSNKTINQNNISSTSIPNQNDVRPINTLIPVQNNQQITPIPKPTSTLDSSKINLLLYISISILVIGSIGNFLYWKHEKYVIESINTTKEDQ